MNTPERVYVDESPDSGRYQLSAEDRQKSVSPESRAKRRATLAQRRADRAEAVLWLRREGWVPEAIADYLGISDGQVRAYVREAKRSRRRR